MRKLMDKCAFSIDVAQENKCIFGLSQNFVVMDINAKKNAFDIIYPRVKHCNKMFWSEDKLKILFLNTTGTAVLYDAEKGRVVADKICFGEDLYNQCFVSYKNGFFYLNQEGIIKWFDYSSLKMSNSQFSGKYSFIYDDEDRGFFISIDEPGKYPHYNLLSIRCFSKKLAQFEEWSVRLPKGNLSKFRYICNKYYLVVMEQEERKKIHTKIYLFDTTNNSLNYLFEDTDFLDNESEEYFLNFETDIDKKRGYVLYSNSLKVVDLDRKTLIHSISFKYTWDLKIVSDMLVVATGNGVYILDLHEIVQSLEA